MAIGKTWYDVIEVARTASADVIEASFQSLRDKLDPDLPGNPSDDGARLRFNALREAYVTLSHPDRRKQYDAKLKSLENAPFEEVFWTPARQFVLLVALSVALGGYWRYRTIEVKAEIARVEAEKERLAKDEQEKRRIEEEHAANANETRKRAEQLRAEREQESAFRQADQITRQNQSARERYERQLTQQQQREEMARQRTQQLAQQEAQRRTQEDERRLRELQYERMRGR